MTNDLKSAAAAAAIFATSFGINDKNPSEIQNSPETGYDNKPTAAEHINISEPESPNELQSQDNEANREEREKAKDVSDDLIGEYGESIIKKNEDDEEVEMGQEAQAEERNQTAIIDDVEPIQEPEVIKKLETFEDDETVEEPEPEIIEESESIKDVGTVEEPEPIEDVETVEEPEPEIIEEPEPIEDVETVEEPEPEIIEEPEPIEDVETVEEPEPEIIDEPEVIENNVDQTEPIRQSGNDVSTTELIVETNADSNGIQENTDINNEPLNDNFNSDFDGDSFET
jgi:pilus assembly protein FimV